MDFKLDASRDSVSAARFFSMLNLIFLARVDLPMPGRPTGTKKSFLTWCMSSVDVKSTINFKSAF